ncbi:MAG: Peptidase PpqF, involved in biosynthesis of pyrroloquinoline quinone [Magnetococcales bacterium]|nr:Peptidase PpqF, involved in biosynthesis of pyrroloquinoline quinone [Magnetococcales bacterium]HIJ85293.1 insulinase family protein [Magnetococcales bacterium]
MKMINFQLGWNLRSRFVDPFTVFFALVLTLAGIRGAYGLESEDLVLDNGLRVILVREPKAPVVMTQVWYRVGAVDEVDGKTGLAHMLEHMMFQGTREVAPGKYSRVIAQNGGEDNASTGWDYTNYWSKLPSAQLDLALRLEADRMRNLVLDAKKLESENLVVREERRMRTDSNPQGRFSERFRSFFFQDHPYGRPIIGWMKDIEGHTLKDLESWYRQYYSPDNAVIVIVGDVDFVQAKTLVRTYFGAFKPSGREWKARLPQSQEVIGNRRLVESDPAARAPVFSISWPAPSYTFGNFEDIYALDLLATVLGGGGSSRLYRHIVVEQQKAVSAQTQYGGSSLGVETFDVFADPRDGLSVAVLEQAVFEEVGALMETLVSDEELQRAKNGVLAERIYARDSIDHLAVMIGQMSVNGLDWRRLVDDYPKKIQEVTAQRIREVAMRYLSRDKAVVGILTP